MRTLKGVKVLVVENNAIDFVGIKDFLGSWECVVLRRVADVTHALRYIDANASSIDVAISSIKLVGETRANPIIDALIERKIPVVIQTGGDPATGVDAQYHHLPVLRKPVDYNLLRETLLRLVGKESGERT
ncbi:MAG: hypothetical protein WA021_01195 [Minisyncoccia bacterium]